MIFKAVSVFCIYVGTPVGSGVVGLVAAPGHRGPCANRPLQMDPSGWTWARMSILTNLQPKHHTIQNLNFEKRSLHTAPMYKTVTMRQGCSYAATRHSSMPQQGNGTVERHVLQSVKAAHTMV
jgi:hypothetical protein